MNKHKQHHNNNSNNNIINNNNNNNNIINVTTNTFSKNTKKKVKFDDNHKVVLYEEDNNNNVDENLHHCECSSKDDHQHQQHQHQYHVNHDNDSIPRKTIGPKLMGLVGFMESLIVLFEVFLMILIFTQLVNVSFKAIQNELDNSSTIDDNMRLFISPVLKIIQSFLPDVLLLLYIGLRYSEIIRKTNWFGITKVNRISSDIITFLLVQVLLFLVLVVEQYFSGRWYFSLKNLQDDDGQWNISNILMMTIKSPVLEEVWFRGLIFYKISNRIPKHLLASAIMASVLFGILHLINFFYNYFSVVYILIQIVVGVLFGINLSLFYHRDKTLLSPILIHIFNNIISIFMPTNNLDQIYNHIYFILIYQSIVLVLFIIKNK
ncbi:putative homeobox transcription factor [Tieghemostelium lacteum]|uniref:Putative homeobox transcription factor n=1 Tax=Tieghemostelium lacteum TaxID=361077 RepID=A0A152A8D9_TIELA|nr:putative homeobox transcription factor [Tieghemostelium lacteum]|eukprot:KYR02500.1 putative homeobox transcription factor [Tieghemostelium lacteum]